MTADRTTPPADSLAEADWLLIEHLFRGLASDLVARLRLAAGTPDRWTLTGGLVGAGVLVLLEAARSGDPAALPDLLAVVHTWAEARCPAEPDHAVRTGADRCPSR